MFVFLTETLHSYLSHTHFKYNKIQSTDRIKAIITKEKTVKSSIPTVHLTQGHGESGAYPRELGEQIGGHPGRGANLSQRTRTL